MKNLVITIGREFGSGGHEIGKRLAKKLGISFYDDELIELAAEKTGYNKEYIKDNDEKTPSFSVSGLRSAFAPDYYQLTTLDNIQIEQYNIVKDIAQKESCVILGRGSDYALRDVGSINVFLYAPLQERVERKLALQNEDEPLNYDDMERKVQQVDKQHRKYYEYYSDKKWGNSQSYDFCINTSALGIDGTVDLIASFVKTYGKNSIMPN